MTIDNQILNEIIPPLKVLESYAKREGMPFKTTQDKIKVISRYKNFGALNN